MNEIFQNLYNILTTSIVDQQFQFLSYFTAIIIGVQLSFYFFYQYYKISDVHLKLNRILLSYGSFTLLIVLGALFINIARLFVMDFGIKDVITRIGWIFAFFSPIGFLSFIILDEFSTIMNQKIVKILMILNLIPIVTVIFIPSTQSPIFIISILFTLSGAYYIFNFQINLIRKSVGIIRKKFIRFIIGEIVSLSSLVFAVLVGLQILPSKLSEIIYYTGIFILLTGFIILFFSVQDFPPFYEFEWKENILKIIIFNQKNNETLYYSDLRQIIDKNKSIEKFREKLGKNHSEELFSGGIAGIESIISAITDSKDDKIKKIKKEDFIILLEYGKSPFSITYTLLVKKELASHLYFLNQVKLQFETFFREMLLILDDLNENQKKLFRSFDKILENILMS